MSDKPSNRNVNVIKANRLLQSKVGSGNIDDERISKSQAVIESDQTDFAPLAHEFLNQLEKALTLVPKEPEDVKKSIQPVIVEIMQIKANAAMFNYNLMGTLANIVLNFLENLDSWDQDTYDIVEAHLKTLRLIINNGMKGNGGEYGTELTTELRDACNRYFARKSDVNGSSDVFFVDL
jgi:hypothetical protein